MQKNMLIIATHNEGKFKEIQQFLHPLHCQTSKNLGLESPEETGQTFIENAILKARYVSQHTAHSCIADDSGLVVPALNGKPGIFSARFSGPNATDEDNRKHLLLLMKDIPQHQRQAFFYCAMVYMKYSHDPAPLIGYGIWEGEIAQTEQGHNGFSYDPIFYLKDYDCTAAQLSLNKKNEVSHRGKALQSLSQQILNHMKE